MGDQQPSSPSGGPGRDPILGLFASGGELDGACPSGAVLGLLESVAAPDGWCTAGIAGSTHDEDAGMLAAAQAQEAHATWLKCAVIRQVIRRHAPEAPGGAMPDPAAWGQDLAHDVASVLRISWQAAVPLTDFAWQLGERLPLANAFLSAGTLTYYTAKIIVDEFSLLDDDQVRRAERLLLDQDLAADDLTPGRLRRLCQHIAVTVDPDNAENRRKQRERDARLDFCREPDGTMSVYGTGLPADQALRADARIRARVAQYQKAGIKEKTDVLRAQAWLDLVNGVTVQERRARWKARQAAENTGSDGNSGGRDSDGGTSCGSDCGGSDCGGSDCGGSDCGGSDSGGSDSGGSDSGGGDCGCGDSGGGECGDRGGDRDGSDGDERVSGPGDLAGSGDADDNVPFPDEPADLDDRFPPHEDDPGGADGDDDPGGADRDDDGGGPDGGDSGDGDPDEGDGGGPDEGDYGGPDGGGGGGNGPRGGDAGTGPVPAGDADPGLPALVNLTFPLATVLGHARRPGEAPGFGAIDPGLVRQLASAAAESPRSRFCVTFTDEQGHAVAHGCARLIRTRHAGEAGPGTGPPGRTRDGPPGAGWDFTRDTTRPGPEGGHGAWTLTTPAGARYRVDVHAIPLRECDHRYATDAYRPGALLRHLVEVRDGECTSTVCSHPARNCDFEHAVPWHNGGRTDACNGGMRSRRCHRVKQSPGWRVTQPEPGWHRWEAPSGRSYTKAPKRYPS